MNKQWKLHMKYFMVEKQYPCSKCDKIFDFLKRKQLQLASKVTLLYLPQK